jgi:hypothetical protein
MGFDMTGTRFLALFLAACALLASALVAIPLDGAEAPTASTPDPATYRLTGGSAPAVSPPPATTDEQEAGLPRLWLGNPMGR